MADLAKKKCNCGAFVPRADPEIVFLWLPYCILNLRTESNEIPWIRTRRTPSQPKFHKKLSVGSTWNYYYWKGPCGIKLESVKSTQRRQIITLSPSFNCNEKNLRLVNGVPGELWVAVIFETKKLLTEIFFIHARAKKATSKKKEIFNRNFLQFYPCQSKKATSGKHWGRIEIPTCPRLETKTSLKELPFDPTSPWRSSALGTYFFFYLTSSLASYWLSFPDDRNVDIEGLILKLLIKRTPT